MSPSAQENYLETEVMTAKPQKLQLMLVEAAIRSVERTREHWRADRQEEAHETLIHAQRILTELIAGLNREVSPELVRKVAAVYLFVFRTLTDAGVRHDEKALEDTLRVLEIERDTWRQVCRKLGDTKEAGNDAAEMPSTSRATAAGAPYIPDLPSDAAPGGGLSPGLSLEA